MQREIDERKQAEEELIEERDKVQSYLDVAGAIIMIVNSDQTISLINKKGCDVLGFGCVDCGCNDIIGKNWFDNFIPERAKDQVKSVFHSLMAGEIEPVEYHENPVLTKSGRERIISWHNSILRDNEGKITGILSSGEDITERKHAQEALHESENRYRSFVQNFQGIAFRGDMEFVPVFFQGAVEEITGYSEEEFIAGEPSWDKVIHPDHLQPILAEVTGKLCLIPNYSSEREYRIIRKDGQIRWVYELIQNVCDDSGSIAFVQGAIYDITERKYAEEALRNALAEVEQLKNRLEAENIYLKNEIKTQHDFEEIVSHGPAFRKVLGNVEQVAPTNTTVLVLGETGTGKELLARAIHYLSDRKDRSLVKVDCAALPPNLIESELFGHEKGAFTGAHIRKTGRFELADGGTIFLDEIGDLPLELQTKLLRVLQDKEFVRLGGTDTIKVDVRVIAATNRDLKKAADANYFRRDLYYRLNVFPIQCPPLRDRKDDIPFLVNHFIVKYSAKTGKKIDRIPKSVMNSLQNYHWPGNVRELENIIERAVILSSGPALELEDPVESSSLTLGQSGKTLKEVERSLIVKALRECNWVIRGRRGAFGYPGQHLTGPNKKIRDRETPIIISPEIPTIRLTVHPSLKI